MANPPLRHCSFGTTTLPLGAQVAAKRSVVWDPNINNTHTYTPIHHGTGAGTSVEENTFIHYPKHFLAF